ncbi:MAG: flagellar biosynthesis protein FliR [Thermoleophilaceae bacterium]|nr:flagellar biosynthesis protein FliR [Thermoleophilaceae bacterium]
MNALIQQVGASQTAGFFLVLARISPLFVLAPIFSSRLMPARARGIAAVALAVGMAPAATAGKNIPLDVFGLGSLIAKELLIGMAFAFAVAVVFNAISIAGSFLDTLVGFSYGSLIDPVTGAQSPVLSQMYGMFGVLIFIAIGGDGWMIQGLAKTYDLVPLLSFPSLGALVGGANSAFVQIFVSALELAAPVLIAVTITDAAFGIVARVSPQMNVFQVGLPAKIMIALLVMGASLPFAAGWISDSLQGGINNSLQSLKVAR